MWMRALASKELCEQIVEAEVTGGQEKDSPVET